MDKIFEAYETKKVRTIRGDFIDRLHSDYTVTLLLAICILVGLRQYEKDGSIVCWLPLFFSGDQIAYAHQLCWVNNTYHYPLERDADAFPSHDKHIIHYYQYILFVLFVQALLFYLPSVCWSMLTTDSTGYMNKLLDQIERNKLILQSVSSYKDRKRKSRHHYRRNVVSAAPAYRSTLSTGSAVSAGGDSVYAKESLSPIREDDQVNFDINSKDPDLAAEKIQLIDLSKVDEQQPLSDEEDAYVSNLLPRDFLDSFKSTVRTFAEVEKLKRSSSHVDRHQKMQESLTRTSKQQQQPQQQHSSPPPAIEQHLKIISFMAPKSGAKNLAISMLLLKCFNLLNVLMQVAGLHYFLDFNVLYFGFEFFAKIYYNMDPFATTKQFPIMTFCDFFVHQNLRQIYGHSTQCVLPINLFIEKFFVILWFWMIFLVLVTMANIAAWIHDVLVGSAQRLFVNKYLRIKMSILKQDTPGILFDDLHDLDLFIGDYLGKDGFVMLHLIKLIIGDIIFLEMLFELWLNFKKQMCLFTSRSLFFVNVVLKTTATATTKHL